MADIEIRGDAELRRKLQRFATFTQDLRPFWPLVPPLFREWMGEEFDSEGGWGGSPWAPLTADYAARKAAKYPGRPILQASRALWRASRSPQRSATATSLTLTIVDPKIDYHQSGTTRMPARPVIPRRLPFTAERELTRAAETYMDDIARRLGL